MIYMQCRIPFVYTVGGGLSAKGHEKSEGCSLFVFSASFVGPLFSYVSVAINPLDPLYALEQNLSLDYPYYLHHQVWLLM